jgi:CBS domain containing-hemolysin-like protein
MTFVFLLGAFISTSLNSAIRRIFNRDLALHAIHPFFFYRKFHRHFFPLDEYEGLLVATLSAQSLMRFFYAAFSIMIVYEVSSYSEFPWMVPLVLLLYLIGFIFSEFLARVIGAAYPEGTTKYLGPIGSILIMLCFPITYALIVLSRSKFTLISVREPLSRTRKEIFDIIQRAHLGHELTVAERQLIESVLSFKERIAREVMVPRVDVFSLPADTTIMEAAKLIETEGYSRIPVYRNNVDTIVGVLMYKDILNKLMEYVEQGNDETILQAPIETIQKEVLYTPETKKISNLLLEFRKKQVHLAIVVDEYGGTEGIVTIEDILEEIVGEIEDEYDEEEAMFVTRDHDSWIVDARMSILDVEEQFGIKIPQEGDYDTIGGYIFHRAGSIPSKGFIIHEEDFQMEILRSDERRVERVILKKIKKESEEGGAKS